MGSDLLTSLDGSVGLRFPPRDVGVSVGTGEGSLWEGWWAAAINPLGWKMKRRVASR